MTKAKTRAYLHIRGAFALRQDAPVTHIGRTHNFFFKTKRGSDTPTLRTTLVNTH